MTAPTSASSALSPSVPARLPLTALLVLAGAIFLSITSEVLPTGLLPDMSRGLGVPASSIGFLVSIFAGAVVLTSMPLTHLTHRFARKHLVVVVLIVLALSNLLTAISPNYEIVVVSRVLGGMANGLFWTVVGAYAAHLVPRHRLSRALAITSAGGSMAFVLGVPLGTALGHALGWRLAFGAISGAMVLFIVLVVAFLPAVNHRVPLATGEIPIPARRDPSLLAVVLICLIAGIVMAGHNVLYTYIVPFFIGVNGFPESSIALLLFAYGGAGAVGLFVAGMVGSRYPRAGLFVSFSVVVLVVLVIGIFPSHQAVVIGALVVFGIAFGGVPTILQTRLLSLASPRMRDTASAYFTTAFNVAIGLGAFAGGQLLDGFGPRVLPFVDAAVLLLAIVLLVVSGPALNRRLSQVEAAH